MPTTERRPQARLIVREAIADAWASVYGADTRASAQRAARIVEDAVDRLDALYGQQGHATERGDPAEATAIAAGDASLPQDRGTR